MARFTDSKGRYISVAQLPKAGLALVQAARRKWLGIYPQKPWIPFVATETLDRLIRPDWKIWEVGSGMSAIWLATRSAHVTSIEADKVWFDRLSVQLAKERITNVDLRYEWHGHRMSNFDDEPDENLDLLYIDGGPRSECLINGFQKLKAGGYLYMDNWDVEGYWAGAYQWIRNYSERVELISEFDDYAPASFGVTNGILYRKLA